VLNTDLCKSEIRRETSSADGIVGVIRRIVLFIFCVPKKRTKKCSPAQRSRYNKKKCFALQKDSRFLLENSFLKLKDTKHLFLLFGFCLWAPETMDATQG